MKLNDLDLNKFHVFRTVAESGSMREAGEILLRTPSAISQSVTSLEKSLQVKLFTRVGIRLELTETGRRVLRQVKQNEQGLLDLFEVIRDQPVGARGTVTLGMPPGYPAASISDSLGRALMENADLQLRLRFLSHSELAESIRKGRMELALSLQPLSQWDRRIRSLELRQENLVLAVPSRLRALSSSELDELPVVDYYQKPLMIVGWLKHHRLKKVKTKIRFFGANLDHVLRMVHQGVGCAVVPRHVIEEELNSGALIEHALDRRRRWMVSVWINSMQKPEQLELGARAIWRALATSP